MSSTTPIMTPSTPIMTPSTPPENPYISMNYTIDAETPPGGKLRVFSYGQPADEERRRSITFVQPAPMSPSPFRGRKGPDTFMGIGYSPRFVKKQLNYKPDGIHLQPEGAYQVEPLEPLFGLERHLQQIQGPPQPACERIMCSALIGAMHGGLQRQQGRTGYTSSRLVVPRIPHAEPCKTSLKWAPQWTPQQTNPAWIYVNANGLETTTYGQNPLC